MHDGFLLVYVIILSHLKNSALVPVHSLPVSHWLPPKPSEFKLNIDAILNAENQLVDLGVVIRNDAGLVVVRLACFRFVRQKPWRC